MEKDNKVTIVSIILAIIAFVILGFILYYKANKPVVPEKEEKPVVIDEPVKKDETDYEKLSKELYDIIGDNPEFRYEEKVTFDTLSESVRDSIVLSRLTNTCEEVNTFSQDEFLKIYKSIFNHDKTLEEGLCKLNLDVYECRRYCSEQNLKIYKVFEKYEKTDEEIVLYENVGHLDYFDDGKVYLKENAIDSEAIASFDSLDDLMNSTITYKLPSYKHIFKKLNDNYYWESSELVKQ